MQHEAILSSRVERYTSTVERTIGLNHRLGSALTLPFYGMPRPSFDLALRNPALSSALVTMINGQIGYGRLILWLIASFPAFILGLHPFPRPHPLHD